MRFAFFALLFALAPVGARATTVEPLDDRALVDRSDLIARVVVTGMRAERVGRRVITFYDVEIKEAWRTRDTAPPKTAVVALPGGTVDGIGQLVPGTPVLVVGRAYVLCLGDDVGPQVPSGRARGIVGLWLGAFAVTDAGPLRSFTHGGPPALVDEAALRTRLMGAR